MPRSDALTRVCTTAAARGGQCLSPECPSTVTPKAEARNQYNLARVRAVAEAHGGLCLSTECRTRQTRITLQCAHGHIWDAAYNKVLAGHWCQQCSYDKKRGTLEEVQQMAATHGGKCLSTEYINRLTKLRFECKHGHTWEATPNKIQQGMWCRQCALAARTTPLAEIQAMAAARGGVCLSTEYVTKKTKLQFRCANGHVFELRFPGFRNKGDWCKYCHRLSLAKMQEVAAERGGKCLSTEYINSKTHLLWECADGHQWWAVPSHVHASKTWCPVCRYVKQRKKAVKNQAAGEQLRFGKSSE